jgi:hypothetical protein
MYWVDEQNARVDKQNELSGQTECIGWTKNVLGGQTECIGWTNRLYLVDKQNVLEV